jgi:hypothetical protein
VKAIVMVHGWRGTGKTFFVHASAWAVSAGGYDSLEALARAVLSDSVPPDTSMVSAQP